MITLDLQRWVNRTEVQFDDATLAPAAMLAATLGRQDKFETGSVLPPLWHWLYFLPKAPHNEIGRDGHPRRGGFLPPVTLPRRMWAGSRLQWNGELRIGDTLRRTSTIESVETKSGRTGELVFVRVRHEVARTGGEAVLTEWQDIVYREASKSSNLAESTRVTATVPAAAPREWQQTWEPDPVLLFRFSALTFNSHRIHYDRSYATQEEGYPGLVVHGPLLAMLMMQLATEKSPGHSVSSFNFRGLSPVVDSSGSFDVCGAPGGDGTKAEMFVQAAGIRSTEGQVSFHHPAQR